MLLKTALRLTLYEKEKFAGAVAGVMLALVMVTLQTGFYLGYRRDTTMVLDSFDADIWVIPKHQLAFEVWAWMDDLPFAKIRSHPALEKCGRMTAGYAPWRMPSSGTTTQAFVVGFEFDSGIGTRLPMRMLDPRGGVRADGHVMVGTKDCARLGIVDWRRDRGEIFGREARVVGLVDEVHLFNTSSFVLTDLDNGRAFLRQPPSRIAFILAKCRPGANQAQVIRELRQLVPEHEVLSTQEFHDRSSDYWANRTGFGPVLLLAAGLAVVVGFLIVTLMFYIATTEKLPVFASLKALGASTRSIVLVVLYQVVIVFFAGTVLAGIGVYAALLGIATTQISVVITRNTLLAALGVTFLCLAAGALFSIRRLAVVDPGEAFRT